MQNQQEGQQTQQVETSSQQVPPQQFGFQPPQQVPFQQPTQIPGQFPPQQPAQVPFQPQVPRQPQFIQTGPEPKRYTQDDVPEEIARLFPHIPSRFNKRPEGPTGGEEKPVQEVPQGAESQQAFNPAQVPQGFQYPYRPFQQFPPVQQTPQQLLSPYRYGGFQQQAPPQNPYQFQQFMQQGGVTQPQQAPVQVQQEQAPTVQDQNKPAENAQVPPQQPPVAGQQGFFQGQFPGQQFPSAQSAFVGRQPFGQPGFPPQFGQFQQPQRFPFPGQQPQFGQFPYGAGFPQQPQMVKPPEEKKPAEGAQQPAQQQPQVPAQFGGQFPSNFPYYPQPGTVNPVRQSPYPFRQSQPAFGPGPFGRTFSSPQSVRFQGPQFQTQQGGFPYQGAYLPYQQFQGQNAPTQANFNFPQAQMTYSQYVPQQPGGQVQAQVVQEGQPVQEQQ